MGHWSSIEEVEELVWREEWAHWRRERNGPIGGERGMDPLEEREEWAHWRRHPTGTKGLLNLQKESEVDAISRTAGVRKYNIYISFHRRRRNTARIQTTAKIRRAAESNK